jgi:hypothetical protein
MDSKPIAVCQPIRHGRVILLREDGAYFGKSSKGWFFGIKLHLIRNIEGAIVNLVLTRGNCDDREGASLLMQAVNVGVTLADLGYRAEDFKEFMLEEAGLLVITKDEVREDDKFFISQLRSLSFNYVRELGQDFRGFGICLWIELEHVPLEVIGMRYF